MQFTVCGNYDWKWILRLTKKAEFVWQGAESAAGNRAREEQWHWERLIGSVTARQSSIGCQLKCAALNRGRYLYSAGWPSRWALAHILVQFYDCILAPPGEYDKMDCGRQPSRKWHKPPPLFGPCLLWPNGRPSQLLLSTCTDDRPKSVA